MNSKVSLKVSLYYAKKKKNSRAIAQAVSRRLTTAAARVWAKVRSCGICGEQSGAGAGFLPVLRFPLSIINHRLLHIYSLLSIIRGWYSRPFSGRRTKWTRSHPTPRNKNIICKKKVTLERCYTSKQVLFLCTSVVNNVVVHIMSQVYILKLKQSTSGHSFVNGTLWSGSSVHEYFDNYVTCTHTTVRNQTHAQLFRNDYYEYRFVMWVAKLTCVHLEQERSTWTFGAHTENRQD
jgi:hypothetical protein